MFQYFEYQGNARDPDVVNDDTGKGDNVNAYTFNAQQDESFKSQEIARGPDIVSVDVNDDNNDANRPESTTCSALNNFKQ